MRSVSLRSRLALLYAGLAVVSLMAVLAAVYVVARHEQIRRLDSEAMGAATAFATEVRDRPPEAALAYALRESNAGLERGQLLALIDRGRVVAGNATARQLARAVGPARRSGSRPTATVPVGEHTFRTATAAAGRDRTTVAAISFDAALESREALVIAVAAAGGFGILLTAFGAWLAARRTLRPLTTIARTAALVAPGDLSHRTGAKPRDEIGEVGAAIDRMLQRLEEAFAAQRRFLQDASHELRTPLTIAQGHLEVLAAEDDPEPEELHATLALVLQELDGMGRLVSALLELVAADEPHDVRVEQIDAGELLSRIARDFEVVTPREWRVEVGRGTTLLGDPHAVQRIVVNLVRNALDHSDDGNAIELAARRVNGTVAISVRDHGPGIDPAIGDAVFERFVHGSSEGFGLGLAIARTLAERQGGTIRHERPDDGGARFVVQLPAAG